MKATQALVLLLLLLALQAGYALPWEPQGSPPKWKRPSPGILPSPILFDPELRECWTHLRRPPGCMSSIYESSEKCRVRLSHDCCLAVKALSNRCFQRIFTDKPFALDFSQKIDGYCASAHGAYTAHAPAL
ncbi:hypothetical protein KSP40_PGU003472 [Platanthera guangdongensis]|uniref:Prolamin-like domain-containing protein n=1 Tax=Platanthera guangdongensis TaxID=2320717 RepID=A0ABR2MIV5_9ASPA